MTYTYETTTIFINYSLNNAIEYLLCFVKTNVGQVFTLILVWPNVTSVLWERTQKEKETRLVLAVLLVHGQLSRWQKV